MSAESPLQININKMVVAFRTSVRSRPYTVNGKEYERFFALIHSRSETGKILNSVYDSLEKEKRLLEDVRLVDLGGNRVFYIPSTPFYTERTRKSGRTLRVSIPAEVGRHVIDKEVFIYAYVGEGDGSVKRVDGKSYDAVVVYDSEILKTSSVIATVPVRYSNIIPIGKEVEVDIITVDTIKTVRALTYKNGSYRGLPLVSMRFNRDEVEEFLDKSVTLVVKVI